MLQEPSVSCYIFLQVAKIDVKDETPINHGEIICFSIYSGKEANYFGKSCIWVDVLDGGRNVLMEFAPFFESPSIKKVVFYLGGLFFAVVYPS